MLPLTDRWYLSTGSTFSSYEYMLVYTEYTFKTKNLITGSLHSPGTHANSKGNQWTSGKRWAHPCREIMLWINNNKYCKRSFLLKMSLDGLAASWATANTTPDGGQKVMVRNSMVIVEKLVIFWTMSPKFVCSPSM